MHTKTRSRGKVIRYIKNPNYTAFSRPVPLSETRAIIGQHAINKNKNSRTLKISERNTPTANKNNSK